MKYLDNVIRNLAVCVGTIVITLLSWLVFKNPLTIQFVIGGLLVLGSVLLYRLSPPPSNEDTSGHELVATSESHDDEMASKGKSTEV